MCGTVLCRSISFRSVLYTYTECRAFYVCVLAELLTQGRLESYHHHPSVANGALKPLHPWCRWFGFKVHKIKWLLLLLFFNLLSPVHYMEKLWATITPAAYVHILVLFDEFYVLWLCVFCICLCRFLTVCWCVCVCVDDTIVIWLEGASCLWC